MTTFGGDSDVSSAADLLASAVELARRGWHVFPLRPNDKRPAFPDHTVETCTGRDPRCHRAGAHVGWEPRATTDPDRIRRAWTAAPYNVGIACGPSGLVVIDLDVRKPGQTAPQGFEGYGHGARVLADLCLQAGHPYPDDTHAVTTGGGGTHLYYQHPPDGTALRNTRGGTGNALGWLIDTRGHGGYVVAAGSVVAGRPYQVAREMAPAPLPDWLAQRLRPTPPAPSAPSTRALPGGQHHAYLTAVIDRECAHVTAAPDHHNDNLYIAAVNLGRLVAGGALTPEDATQALEHAGVVAGLRPAAARRTIASGLRAGAARPRQLAA
ncbi:bifunctional DNA primase/polymerase [Phytohabitans houttuyneae]|uniref:bifunctional DNA primase/polymerase n=1 Tax=Phytohabitans houttuyneae TaxID=1076126 RepID=UPI0031E6A7BA